MKTTKRILALVICVMMIAAMLPAGIFADDTTTEETTLLSNDFDIYLPFDDAVGWSATYFGLKSVGSNLVYSGTSDSGSSLYWGNYAVEDGNKYSYLTKATLGGYSIKNATGYDNFNKPFQIKLRMNLHFLSTTTTGELFIPVVRLSDSTNATGGISGFTNVLAVKAPSTTATARSADDEVIGTIGHCTNSGAGSFVNSGYTIYANTWYDIELLYNPANGKGYWKVTDGTNSYIDDFDNSQSMDMINQVVLFRLSGSKNAIGMKMDDLRLTSNIKFESSTDMSDLVYATGTNAETGESETYTYASAAPNFLGFAASGSNNTWWNLIDENGNKYISRVKGSNANTDAKPITLTDSFDVLDTGAFAYTYAFKYGEGVPSNGAGMLSVKIGDVSDVSELRIINMTQDGSLYFGVASSGTDFKIGQLTTTASKDGARWHTIRVEFHPYIAEDYADMCYRFYIDGELAAYSIVVKGIDDAGEITYSYNFYTKASGSWTGKTDITASSKRLQYVKSGDTNENGVEDEGETFVYAYKWETDGDSWNSGSDNVGRQPVGYWDGYDKEDLDGTVTKVTPVGDIAAINSLYMFHDVIASLSLDNLKVETIEESDPIEYAELIGYQLGSDGESVRLIAGIDSLEFGRVGMDIDIYEENVGWTKVEDSQKTDSVYISITADRKIESALEQGCNFIYMFSIVGIDGNGVIRVSPYATKDGVKYYGESKSYIITFEDKVSVSKAKTYTTDYSDGLDTTGNNNGYCCNSWSSYSWADLNEPNADIGWGGEGTGHTATLTDDGSVKLTSALYVNAESDTNYHTTKDEDGNIVRVTDAEGNELIKNFTHSRRIKFAYVIPTDLENYIGYTFVISARIKATAVGASVSKNVEVGGVSYAALYDEVVEKGTASIEFGFMTDYKTNMISSNTYTISDDGEWIEVTASLTITTDLLTKNANMTTITDEDVNTHYSPLRPTLNMGSTSGYLSESYIDDITLTIIPGAE